MASLEEETALQLLLTTDALRASEELVASLRDEIARLKASGFEHTELSIDDDNTVTPEQTRTRARSRTRSRSRRNGSRIDTSSAVSSSSGAVSTSTTSQKSRETLQRLEEYLGKRSTDTTTLSKSSLRKKRRRTLSASKVSEAGFGSSVKKGRSQKRPQTKVIRRTGRVEGLSTCVTLNGVKKPPEQKERERRGVGSKKKKKAR